MAFLPGQKLTKALSRNSNERCLEVSAERRTPIRRYCARRRIRYDAGDIGEHALDNG